MSGALGVGLRLQSRTNSVACLGESSLHTRHVADRVEQDEVMDHPVVAGCGHWNASVHEFAPVGLALVAKRIVFGGDNERHRHWSNHGFGLDSTGAEMVIGFSLGKPYTFRRVRVTYT